MATDLVLTPPETAITPVELIRIYVSQGAGDVEKLKQLMDLHERWEANEARKAFVKAMAAFKASPPTIHKTKDGPKLGAATVASYKYAPLDEVCNAIVPALSAVGISHRWVPSYEGEWIVITCILTHELGHSESATLRGCDDKGPGRNAIQASCSTVTYLERYTLLAACGLAVRGQDSDAAGNPNALEPQYVQERIADIKKAESAEDLQERFKHAYAEASKANDKRAQAEYIAAKDARKKALHANH